MGNCPLCIYVIRKVSFICLWLSEASNKKHIHVPIPSSSQQHRRREKIINCYVSQVKRTHSLSVRPHVYQWEIFQDFTLPTLNSPIQLDEKSATRMHAVQCTKNHAGMAEVLFWWCSAVHQTLIGHGTCPKLTRLTKKSNC